MSASNVWASGLVTWGERGVQRGVHVGLAFPRLTEDTPWRTLSCMGGMPKIMGFTRMVRA